jgi:peptidoglycan/LPS O-acetylase OafA/YrhL
MATAAEARDIAKHHEGVSMHFPCFDGLRAIAAIFVLFHHAGFSTGVSMKDHGVGPYLARMDSGVTIFFLISGFLLYRPFVVAHLSGRHPLGAMKFYGRRVLRIFPAYWVALIGIVTFFGLQLHGAKSAAIYAGLVQIYDTKRFFGGISQAWSLATEISYYLVLPAYAWAVRRVARRSVNAVRVELVALAALVGGGLLFRTLLFPVPAGPASYENLLRYWLPAHLDLFGIGMLLAVISAAGQVQGREWGIARALGRVPSLLWWALAALCLYVVSWHVGLPEGLQDGTPAQEWQRHGLYAAMALFLLLPAVFGPQPRGVVRRFLASPPMYALGLVSYGIYIWHQAWLGKALTWTGGTLFDAELWKVAGLGFVCTVATATASYLLVEKPILRVKDRPALKASADVADQEDLPALAEVAP